MAKETWQGHPFNAANNVTDLNGDANNHGRGTETHALKLPAVTHLQETYARKVVDTLNALDHVLYKVSNESEYGAGWHYHLIKVLHDYEATKPKQHPVGMTGAGPKNSEMINSDAEWISPETSEKATYKTDPPPNDIGRVSLLVVTWGMKDRKHLPTANWQPGLKRRLTVDLFEAHPEFRRMAAADDTEEYSLTPHWVLKVVPLK